MRQLGFIGPAYQLGSLNVDAQECVNWFPEVNELGTGKNQEVAALVQRPGLTKVGTAGVGPSRGMWERSLGDARHMVSGNQLFDITDPANPVDKGTLITSSGRVGMADNGLELLIVDGEKGYVLTYSSGAFAQITDPDFPRASACAFQDQYLIVNEVGTRRFHVSALSDAMNWDGLDFASKEGLPDNILALIVDHRELFLAGLKSSEFWVNTGNADFPFERVDGAYLEHGMAAADTLVKFDNSIYGVGRAKEGHGMIGRLQGHDPVRISSIPIERAINGYGDISAASAWTYELNRHAFYMLNVPGSSTTWAFDAHSNLWHERRSMDANGVLDRWRAEGHVFDGTRHLVGDYQNGNIYKLDEDAFTDDGQPIFRRRRAPHLAAEGRELFCGWFQLDMEAGAGPSPPLLDGLGHPRAPIVMLRISKDGGHTWSSERWTSAGKIGEHKRRAMFRRLGRARDWIFEITVTDPIKATLISGLPEFEAARTA